MLEAQLQDAKACVPSRHIVSSSTELLTMSFINAEDHMEGSTWDVVLIKKRSLPSSYMQLPVIRATCEKFQMNGINDV